MGKKDTIQIIIEAKDNASGVLKGVGSTLGSIGVGVGAAAGAILAGGVAIGKVAYDLASAAMANETVQNTFKSLASSVNISAESMLSDMQKATGGMVANDDLMLAANKFLSLGIADTSEEITNITELSTKLGMAMGKDASTSAEEMANILANQTTRSLRDFGISADEVEQKVKDLQAANSGLSDKEAFAAAVMEVGSKTLQKVGDQSQTTAGKMATFKTSIANLKDEVGEALLPVLGSLTSTLTPLIQNLAPGLISMAGQLATIFTTDVIPAVAKIAENLMPALTAIMPVVSSIFGQLASDLFGTLVPAVLQLVAALLPIIQTILPPLITLISTIVSWLVSKLVPVIQVVAAWIGTNLPVAFGYLAKLWKNTLQPALSGLWDFLTKVWDAFKKIGDAVSKVIQFFKDLVNGIKNIKLPDWLTPGSPTPFELGLRGIASALSDVNSVIPTTFSGLPDGTVVGGGSSVSNQPLHLELHIHSAINLADKNYIEKELFPYIVSGVRQMKSQGAI